MGDSNKVSGHFRNCEEISNSFFFSTPDRVQLPKKIRLFLKEKPVVTEEIGNLLKKVAIEKLQSKRFLKKSVFVQSISSKAKEWKQQACHQFEKSKSVHPQPSFQTGDPTILQAGWLYAQIGPKGWIFLHLTSAGVAKICEILLGWRHLYQFLCLCFGLAPAPYVLIKFLKKPIAFL